MMSIRAKVWAAALLLAVGAALPGGEAVAQAPEATPSETQPLDTEAPEAPGPDAPETLEDEALPAGPATDAPGSAGDEAPLELPADLPQAAEPEASEAGTTEEFDEVERVEEQSVEEGVEWCCSVVCILGYEC
jgi:hypothetical protein